MMWGGALGLLPILSFPPGECCQTSLNFFFPLFSLFLLLFQKIIYSHSRKLTESLNTFANPLLPSRRVLPNIPQLFPSIFSFFFCQSSKASSSKESQQTIYSRLVNVIFSPSRLRMKRWIDELKTESQIKKNSSSLAEIGKCGRKRLKEMRLLEISKEIDLNFKEVKSMWIFKQLR